MKKRENVSWYNVLSVLTKCFLGGAGAALKQFLSFYKLIKTVKFLIKFSKDFPLELLSIQHSFIVPPTTLFLVAVLLIYVLSLSSGKRFLK